MWPFRSKQTPDLAPLLKRILELEERADSIESKHTRLRGVVYGRKMHKHDPEDDTAGLSREELKRRLLPGRFMPGKPTIHD